MPKTPSPCVGVCRFDRPGPAGRHCRACSMTKAQKRIAKPLRKDRAAMTAFVALVVAQQAAMGRYRHWPAAYARRCAKKGVAVPETAAAPPQS